MENNYANKLIIAISFLLSTFVVSSQQMNTVYFMDNVPSRTYLNPAFQPLGNFYLSMPLIGFSNFNIKNNSLVLKDIVYNQNGKPVLFANPEGDLNRFYNVIQPTLLAGADVQMNLVGLGFRTRSSYWNLSVTGKVSGELGVPKDLVKLAFFLTPDMYNNYDFKNLGLDFSMYTEVGLGYSLKINDKWSVGAKFKYLLGAVNMSAKLQKFDLNASIDEWNINGNGTINIASPVQFRIGNSVGASAYDLPATTTDWAKPSGNGAGLDVGFTFVPAGNLTFSAALTDLGFIKWKKNVSNITFNEAFSFGGKSFDVNTGIDLASATDSIIGKIKDSNSILSTSNAYTTYTSPKLNVGIEYGFFHNKLSLGILSKTIKRNSSYLEQLTGSINGKPIKWVNLSVSYSHLSGGVNSLGAGIGLCTGFLHWLLSADYIPLKYVSLPLSELSRRFPSVDFPAAYHSKGVNLALGLNIVFGYKKDKDKDRVAERKVQVPGGHPRTTMETQGETGKNSYPADSAGNGTPGHLDKFPKTLGNVKADQNALPLDTISGAVADSTSKGEEMHRDSTAKPASPKPGNTPIEFDGDSVPATLDKSPATAEDAQGMVDKVGVPEDTDADGVPGYQDKYPAAKGASVSNGYPEPVNNESIPEKPKPAETDSGLETGHEIVPEYQMLFHKALQGVQFENGNDRLLSSSYNILNQIAGVLINNPNYFVEVRGFTDNVGNPAANKVLSMKRALAVKDFLVKHGIDENRLNTQGFGAEQPVATNKTEAGRRLNRRVEFIVSYVETTVH